MMHYIYKITNVINNKIYIGQTNNPNSRWSKHKYDAKHNKNLLISRAIRKYGISNFIFDVIVTCRTQCDVNITEEQVIKQFDSCNKSKGYNVSLGGMASLYPQIIKNKISNSLKQFYKSNPHHMKNKKMPDDWKNNISKSSMGKLGSNKNKKFSNEWKLKLSKSQIGKSKLSKRKFLPEIENQIFSLYRDGKSAYSLAKQFNCAKNTIISILKRNNVPIRKINSNNNRNIFSVEQEKYMCAIYLLGNISIVRLSEQFNCGKTTVRDILLRNNIKL